MQTTGLESLEGLADARYELAIHGRYGDNTIGHLTPGEMVLPRPLADDPVLKRQLFDAFERHELNPYQYQVGHFENSINPLTGAPEFGWFKKLGKSIKKKATVIGQVVGFAVGGPAGAAIGGGIGGGVQTGSLKGAVKGAATGYVLGSVAQGAGVKGGTFGKTTFSEGIKSLNPFDKTGMLRSLNPATPGTGGVGGVFQDIGAGGRNLLSGAINPATGKPFTVAETFGKGSALAKGYGDLGFLGKGAVAGLGLASLPSSFTEGMMEGQDPEFLQLKPSGGAGGFLQQPLRNAQLPTQYPGAGGPRTGGITQGGMSMSSEMEEFLRSTMNDEEYSKLLFPQFNEGGDVNKKILEVMKTDTPPDTSFTEDMRKYLKSNMSVEEYNKLVFPRFNQGGVMDMRYGGGNITDPNGSGEDDTVNAMLADGEFVMTKQAVSGLGNGDHEAGISRLYAMMDKNENKAQGMGIGRA
tara:strand:- start:197 stop:1597 length:1401 start_codon:yes stop_codon:yes gene_type:complete